MHSATEKTVLLGAAPIHDCKGKIVGAVATFKDITALKRAERSLMINEKLMQQFLENQRRTGSENLPSDAMKYVDNSLVQNALKM